MPRLVRGVFEESVELPRDVAFETALGLDLIDSDGISGTAQTVRLLATTTRREEPDNGCYS